jgi:glucokinase
VKKSVYLGFDIGGTKMAVVLGSNSGEVIDRVQFPSTTPEETQQNFVTLGKELLAKYPNSQLEGCGISAPGPMSSQRGLILDPPNNPLWRNVPVKSWIEAAFKVPTKMENDANAGALAEWLWGYKKEVANLIYFTCGTGLGAGLILDGKLFRGKQDLAGEIGHIRMLPLGPVGYYKAGSLEGLASGKALGELARIRLAEPHPNSVLDQLKIEEVHAPQVGEAALAGDSFARAIVIESATYLGSACGMLLDILNPEKISLGSLAVRLGGLYIDAVRAAAKKEALPEAYRNCIIDAAALGESVQDMAALAVAVS